MGLSLESGAMKRCLMPKAKGDTTSAPVTRPVLQRRCACGTHANGGECQECKQKHLSLQRSTPDREPETSDSSSVPPIVDEVLRSPGQPLDPDIRAFFEPRFGYDFSHVRVHTDRKAAESARAVNAAAYTVGREMVFGEGQYSPGITEGQRLIAHELTHAAQQGFDERISASIAVGSADSDQERAAEVAAKTVMGGAFTGQIQSSSVSLHRRAAPYINKVKVHLAPPQSAELEWEGTPPADATGSDNFTVSTGKGYGDPDDPPGTCTRACCGDAMTQCAPPWNRPDKVGACCTYYGNDFWTGTPLEEHNGWKWWTPVQPWYSKRGIALHQHDEVTGQPIGHGCVRMDEPNAKRIYDYSNGRRTNVTIDGRAAPVACDESRRCAGTTGARGELETQAGAEVLASGEPEAVPGLEGLMT